MKRRPLYRLRWLRRRLDRRRVFDLNLTRADLAGPATSSMSKDGWEVAWAHDRGEYGLDRERRGSGKVNRFGVE